MLRRLGAGAIDWVLCWIAFLIASIVGGIVQGLGRASLDAGDLGGIPGAVLIVLSQLIVAAPIVTYFAYYWAQGSTLGMRAVDIELVREATARPPGWTLTFPRAIIACLVALAVLNVYLASSGRPEDDPFNAYERALIVGSVAAAGVGLAAKAWMFVDQRPLRPRPLVRARVRGGDRLHERPPLSLGRGHSLVTLCYLEGRVRRGPSGFQNPRRSSPAPPHDT